VEEVYMSAISNERGQEVSAEVEMVEDGLVEVGKVSETKGGLIGVSPDVGNGFKNGG
jgi:hypothetical protein